jgi:hypothetical protein
MSENDQYDITSIKDINNIKFPPLDFNPKIEEEGALDDDGQYTIDRGAVVGQNKYGVKYKNNNYIESENPYENIRALDLNSANDDIGAYEGNWKDVAYSNANAATVDQYGNAYNTENVGNDLGRFDEQLKRTKKSRFAEDAAFTDDEYAARDKGNEDMAFMRAYEEQKFEPNFQIGRSRRKRTLAEVTADKQRSRNMLQAILRDTENFPRGNLYSTDGR